MELRCTAHLPRRAALRHTHRLQPRLVRAALGTAHPGLGSLSYATAAPALRPRPFRKRAEQHASGHRGELLSVRATSSSEPAEESSSASSSSSLYRKAKMWARQNNRIITAGINGTAVALVVAGACYKAVEVDLEISRGWTMSEFLLNTAHDDFLNYSEAAKSNPFFTKACTSGVAYLLGDFAAQTFQGRTLFTVDLPRTVRSGLAGFCIHGPLCHLWIEWMEVHLSFGGAWYSTFAKVIADQTVWSIFLNSAYTSSILLLQGKGPDYIAGEVKSTWWAALSSGWRFWPFVHSISFSPFIPAELKLLFIDTMEIVWVTILATVVNRTEETPQLVCNIEPSVSASPPYAVIDMTKNTQRQPYIEDKEGNTIPVVLRTDDMDELMEMAEAEQIMSLTATIDEWEPVEAVDGKVSEEVLEVMNEATAGRD